MKTICLLSIAVLFFAVTPAWAGNSYSIPVSVTIPEIPGVNAPMITTEQTRKQNATTGQNQQAQDNQVNEEAVTDGEDGQTILVKTTYGK